jgi:hypothetical protein
VVRGDRKWEAYACFRDALHLAPPDKQVSAWINLVSVIRSLGKNAFALHELRELSASGVLDAGRARSSRRACRIALDASAT